MPSVINKKPSAVHFCCFQDSSVVGSVYICEVQVSMLRQLFLKPVSATAVRGDSQDGAGPSTPGFDFGGGGYGDAGDNP